ncbi:MAG: nitroreductase family deazaflavin-dependent oxidoreductase [Anaerolineae bacterium]
MALTRSRPGRALRWLLRAPILLYRLRLGWLLGERFLLLTHIGRKTGLPRQAVVEVVHHDTDTGRYIIAAAWGRKADWFRNIQKTPQVTMAVGCKRFDAIASQLSIDEATEALYRYAQSHPAAFRALSKTLFGHVTASTREGCREMAEQIPLVALDPRPS